MADKAVQRCGIRERAENRLAGACDNRSGVGGEPDRGESRSGARACLGEGLLPHPTLTTVAQGKFLGIVEHRMLDEPSNIFVIRLGHIASRGVKPGGASNLR